MDEKAIRKAGYVHGMEDGEKNEKIKIAKNLKKLGIKIEDIALATNLTKEEIEKL